MLIKKLEINRYKSLRGFRETFGPGINLVHGPNESGKSTLVEAFTDLFFADPSLARKDYKDKIGWNADKSFELCLEFEIDDCTYILRKDFDAGEAELTRLSDGEKITEKKKILAVIESGMGLANPEIFLATCAIRQGEIDRVSHSPEAIKDKLEGLITGGQEETLASAVLAKIENRIREIIKDGSKPPGIIQKLEDNKAELIYELDKAKREIDLVAKNRLKLKETQSLLAGIEAEYASKKAHMERATQAAQNEEYRKQLEERFQDLNSRAKAVHSSEAMVARLREELATLARITESDLALADQQTAQINYLQSKCEAAEEKTAELAERLALSRPSPFLRLTAIFFLLVAMASGAYYHFIMHAADIRFLFGAGAGLLIFMIMLMIWSAKARHASAIKAQLNLKQAALEEIKTDLADAQTALKTIFEKYKLFDTAGLRSAFENYRDIEKEIKNEVRRYESWLDGRTLKELESDLAEILRALTEEQEKGRDLRAYALTAEESDKLNVLVEALDKQRHVLQATEIALKRHLEFAESGCELQASLEERLQEVETAMERWQYQVKVLEIARENIEKARKNVLKASLGMLEDETSQMLSQISGGRYERVRFDRQSLRFQVFSPEKNDWIDPDQVLSRGALDQLYLAARIALVRIISQEHKPVLIFDEPLLTFDKERRQRATQILKQYAASYQMLILSCHDHYNNIAGKKILLAEPSQKLTAVATP